MEYLAHDPRMTHCAAMGGARIVDGGEKAITQGQAIATGQVVMAAETIAIIREHRAKKGDVLGVAQIAGIMAAKRAHELIPMCHPLLLTKVNLDLNLTERGVAITATVETRGQTGVEMEALTAVSVAALTVYDMVKAVDRGMTITEIALQHKTGGKSGTWQRTEPETV